jgi:hypothetical protein
MLAPCPPPRFVVSVTTESIGTPEIIKMGIVGFVKTMVLPAGNAGEYTTHGLALVRDN